MHKYLLHKRENVLRQHIVTSLYFAIAILFLANTWATKGSTAGQEPRSEQALKSDLENVAKEIAENQGQDNFTTSLETKEQADFLLTPALLVQEALQKNTIVTYPTE